MPLSKWCKWLQHLLWLQIFQIAQKFLKQKSKCLHTSENFANHEVTPFTFTFYFNCYVAVLLQNIGSNVNFKNIISTQICSPATLHNVWLYLRHSASTQQMRLWMIVHKHFRFLYLHPAYCFHCCTVFLTINVCANLLWFVRISIKVC